MSRIGGVNSPGCPAGTQIPSEPSILPGRFRERRTAGYAPLGEYEITVKTLRGPAAKVRMIVYVKQ